MMGLNLSGLCGADASACGYQPPGGAPPPPPPPGPCTNGEHAQPCLAGEAIDPATGCCLMPQSPALQFWSQKVTSALYRIAADVGKTVICPILPGVGSFIGGTVLGGVSVELGGFLITLSVAEGAALGAEIGRSVQKELCG